MSNTNGNETMSRPAFLAQQAIAAKLAEKNKQLEQENAKLKSGQPQPVTQIVTVDNSDEIESLRAEVARLKAENAANSHPTQTTGNPLKVSDKGGISIYGWGQFPFTLYPEEIEMIFENEEDLRGFIADHDHELSTKEKK